MARYKVAKRSFFSNVMVLMTGTVLAQALPIAVMPMLTRMYSPEDFGLLALYVAIFSVCSVVASGRYELAIMLPEKDEDAKLLLQASIAISFMSSIFLFFVAFSFSGLIANFLGSTEIEPWIFWVPPAVFFMGCYQSLVYWNNRQKRFKNIALSRVGQSLSVSSTQVSFGYLALQGGLIVGHIAGCVVAVLYLLFKSGSYRDIFKKNELVSIAAQLHKYRNFPKYSVAGALSDSAALQMPVFILTKYSAGAVTGVFSLTFRVLNLPVSLVSAALSQVVFQRIVELSQNNPIELKAFILKVFFGLFVIFMPLVPVMWFWGESIFSFAFGSEWGVAGQYSRFLVFAVWARFCVSPLSTVMALHKNVKVGVLWQVLYLITITVTLLVSVRFGVDVFVKAFVIHEIVLYGIYFSVIYHCTKSIK